MKTRLIPASLLCILVGACSGTVTDEDATAAALDSAGFARAMSQSAANVAHPRLMASHQRFADLRRLAQNDPVLSAKLPTLLAQATSISSRPPLPYSQFVNRPRNGDSLISRANTLALAALVAPTAEQRTDYQQALWSNLAAAAGFPDWNPDVCLDTADFSLAFAVSYDWLYSEWDSHQRYVLREALLSKGLEPANALYAKHAAWVTDPSNRNVACNAGFATAALALSGDVSDAHQAQAVATLAGAYASLHNGALGEYADGGYPEGMRYYDYSLTMLVPFLASLHSVSDGGYGGFENTPGLSQTGFFPIYMRGTSGKTFNFGDATSGGAGLAEAFVLGSMFDNPVFRWDGLQGNSPKAFLWYDPNATVKSPADAGLPLDRVFPSPAAVSMRGSWDDANATYVAFKAGSNRGPVAPGKADVTGHLDLDQGTFVMDALGERWAEDLGDDSYSLAGYFHDAPTSTQPDYRWKYYRKRAEGQNTLVLDPSAARDQRAGSNPLSAWRFKETSAWAQADLTSTSSHVTSWKRGVRVFDQRRQVLIRDEVQATQNVDAWWFMHTRANISILKDGRSALLTLGAKQLLVRISGMPGATFFDVPAQPLPFSPEPACTATSCQLRGTFSNEGIRKLAIHLTGTKTVALTVSLTPLAPGQSVTSVTSGHDVPASTLSDWEHGTNENVSDDELRATQAAAPLPSPLTSVSLRVDGSMLHITSLDAAGNAIDPAHVYYVLASSNPNVATVSAQGVITVHARGSAKLAVYATANGSRQRVWSAVTLNSP